MKVTKISKVKNHLIKYGSITPKQAYIAYGYYRLSDGILKLRRRGMRIRTEEATERGETFAKYHLENRSDYASI